MVDTVQAWPEYQKLLEIVREYGVDAGRITEYLWEQSLRGNVSITRNVKEIPFVCADIRKILWYVIVHRSHISTFIFYHMEGKSGSLLAVEYPLITLANMILR